MKPFKINDEFTVVPQNNLVINEVKLEPRLMKLLCLLVSNNDNLVSREEIIEKIWNGYGGGDDGLTQAISSLRKILNDTEKTVIETVPKSGYIFHGKIEMLQEPIVSPGYLFKPNNSKPINFKLVGTVSTLIIVIMVLIIYIYNSGKNNTPEPDKSGRDTMQNNYTPKPS